MEALAEKLGTLAAKAIAGAIAAGKSRREAIEAAVTELRREDVVSDDLWSDFESYIADTKDFEEHGAG